MRGGSVSREGVQRDLLPLIEGTTVATKYGPMKTDHILFIASGAFHVAKPSDLLPELQGRLPIRVELKALTEEDFVRILSDTRGQPDRAIPRADRHRGRDVDFTDDGIAAVARIAAEVNGQRREYRRPPAADGDGEAARGRQLRGRGHARARRVTVDAAYVDERSSPSSPGNTDLSKYVL